MSENPLPSEKELRDQDRKKGILYGREAAIALMAETNSDRLQEIRERASELHDYFGCTRAGNLAVDDRKWLLQHITEQQKEIEDLRHSMMETLAAKGYRKQERPM